MKITVGSIIKLKNYAGHTGRKGQYAEVKGREGTDWSIRWIKDDIVSTTTSDNVIRLKMNKLSEVGQSLTVGMEIITNADGSKVIESGRFYQGKIGEILANGEGKNTAYIWNNKVEGSSGTVSRPEEWLYSFKIKMDNSRARIIILGQEDTELPDDKEFCQECGELTDTADIVEIGGDIYCQTCADENFTVCCNCDEYVFNDDLCHNEDGDSYCSDCYSEHYTHCNACGEEICHDDSRHAEDSDYCNDCFDERFSYCSECDEAVRHDDLTYNEDDDTYICDNCSGRDRETGEKVIHDYGYRPEAIFNKVKWEQPLYMGVELEVQREYDYIEYSKKFIKFLKEQKTDKHFYLKNDSSLHGKGFEIVTHPFTLQYAHKNLGFQKILKWLKENKLDYGKETGDCGLHVHISKDWFEELDVTKLRLFFRQNQTQLKKFARRNGHNENYCQFEQTTVKDIIAGSEPGGRGAINLASSRETIEIRIFRGEVDIQWFVAVIQFIDAISNFVKKHGITSFIYGEGKYKKNSWLLFTDWAKEQQKYGVMLKYMEGVKLCA